MVASKTAALVTGLALVGNAAAALPALTMKGTKFFFPNGTQFFMKGIAYQEDTAAGGATLAGATYKDPLADEEVCKRDVPILAGAGTNIIRTYAIDPTKDHSACMKLLSDAGIYVVSDLSEPSTSIIRDSPEWSTTLWDRYKAVIDEMSKYDNTMGFFAGNEVSNQKNNTPASAFVKAAVRDSKAYIASKGTRWLGVGYAANDDPDIRVPSAHYFNCGKQEEAIDFWGYNIYSFCGKSTFEQSGYKAQFDFFKNYSVPVFFAEYGCNTQGGAEGRTWEDAVSLYSSQMTPVFSGGIVYMFHQEKNDYGLVKIEGKEAKTMENYKALATVMAKVAPSGVAMNSYNPTNSPQPCPAARAGSNWEAAEALPPTPNKDTCNCMMDTLTCVASSSLKPDNYGALFGQVCGQSNKPCAGITANTTMGVYGAYSMCNATQKLSFVLDAYYKATGSSSANCDWKGQATVVRAKGAQASCSAALSSAAAANSVAATATAGAASQGGNGGNGGGNGGKNAAGSMKELAIGVWAVFAVGIGAAVVAL